MKRLIRVLPYIAPAALLLVAGFVDAQIKIQNPVQVNSIQEFLSQILKAMVMVALPIISLFMVYAGFLFVTARGNEEKLSTAKMNFLYVVIGAILILGAWVLASLLGNTVTEIVRGA